MRIPVRNLWLLQLFASDLYRRSGEEFAGAEEAPEDLPALIARLLADEVTVRLHSGLSVGFQGTDANLTRVRGRIDSLTTVRRGLLDRGLVRCSYDEIVTDTPANRLVRAALDRAAALLPEEHTYLSLAAQLRATGVNGPAPRRDVARSMPRQRLLVRDRRMLTLADLLLRLAIPDPDQNEFVTVAPDDDEHYLRHLFEVATYGFYRHRLEPAGWRVRHGERLYWDVDGLSDGMGDLLPHMQTDITLVAPPSGEPARSRRIVIDTKFTALTQVSRFGSDTLNSGYLYQIYAYLMSQQSRDPQHRNSEGLMLHPVIDANIDEEVTIQGHRIRFATVDLRAPTSTMLNQFTRVLSPKDARVTAG